MMKRTIGMTCAGILLIAGALGCAIDAGPDEATVLLEIDSATAHVERRYQGPGEHAAELRDLLAAQLASGDTSRDSGVTFYVLVEDRDAAATTGAVALPEGGADQGPALDSLAAALGFTPVVEEEPGLDPGDEVGSSQHGLIKLCEASACTLHQCDCGVRLYCLPPCGTVYTPPGGCGYIAGCDGWCSVMIFGICVA